MRCMLQTNNHKGMLSLKFPWSYEISWTQDHFISGQLCVVSVIYVHKSSQVNVKSFLWVFWTGQNQFFANIVLRWKPKMTKNHETQIAAFVFLSCLLSNLSILSCSSGSVAGFFFFIWNAKWMKSLNFLYYAVLISQSYMQL